MQGFNGFFLICAKIVLFLFTTIWGWLTIFAILLASLSVGIAFETKEQKRLAKAANFELKKSEMFFRSLKVICGKLASWITVIPTMIIVIFIAIGISSLTAGLEKFDNFFENRQKIKELNTVVKHLDKKYKVAQVTALDFFDDNVTKIRLDLFDQNAKKIESRTMNIKGKDIFVDALVCNFAFSEIENGSKVNLSIPYRIFSELIPQTKGTNIFPCDTNGVPYIFMREDAEVYGIEKNAFDKRVLELSKTIYDAKEAQKAGIVRNIYGNAVHRKLNKKNDTFIVWTEQTGGLSITADPTL